MIKKNILERFFSLASMQRWNDHLRTLDFTELDKQGHKMILCYVFSKIEEETSNDLFNWNEVIDAIIFEMLQRAVITDLKPELFYRIKNDTPKYIELNKWIFAQIKPELDSVSKDLSQKFISYFQNEYINDVNRKIVSAAHFYSTKWEYDIIEPFNRAGLDMNTTKRELARRQEEFNDLEGFKRAILSAGLKQFIDLCGQLRFQQRWSHIHRVPRTSVLGHMCLVAVFSYLISVKIDACPRRIKNNFFCGLFHDLPESLTRDIVAPVKSAVEGLSDLIKDYEIQEMCEKVFENIPRSWHSEMESFTVFEFKSMLGTSSKRLIKSTDEISKKFNDNKYDPMDGEIIRFADHLTAFMEAYLSVQNGIKNPEFKKAARKLHSKYHSHRIANKKFGKIYEQFKIL